MGDGAVGPCLRPELLERAGPPGPGGRGVGRPAVRDGAPVVRAGRGAAGRGGAGADAGRRADVPVQQPGRAPGAADDGGGLRDGAGHRVRPDPVAAAGRDPARPGLPDQDAAGVPGRAGVRAGLPDRRAAPAADPRLAAAGRPGRPDRGRGLVGGRGDADSRGQPALRGRLNERQHPGAHPGLQRPRPAGRGRDGLGRPRRARRGRRLGVRRVNRAGAAVRLGHGRADQLAAAGRAAGHRRAGLAGLAGQPQAGPGQPDGGPALRLGGAGRGGRRGRAGGPASGGRGCGRARWRPRPCCGAAGWW